MGLKSTWLTALLINRGTALYRQFVRRDPKAFGSYATQMPGTATFRNRWGGSDCGRWVGRDFRSEIRMRESGPEVGGRFPDGIVQTGRTIAERAVKLGRDLGANRQNVQRIVNDLHAEGLVAFGANPHHRRAQLVVLSDKGRGTFDAAMTLQAPWVNGLSEGLAVKDLQAVHRVVTALRKKLESNDPSDRQL